MYYIWYQVHLLALIHFVTKWFANSHFVHLGLASQRGLKHWAPFGWQTRLVGPLFKKWYWRVCPLPSQEHLHQSPCISPTSDLKGTMTFSSSSHRYFTLHWSLTKQTVFWELREGIRSCPPGYPLGFFWAYGVSAAADAPAESSWRHSTAEGWSGPWSHDLVSALC